MLNLKTLHKTDLSILHSALFLTSPSAVSPVNQEVPWIKFNERRKKVFLIQMSPRPHRIKFSCTMAESTFHTLIIVSHVCSHQRPSEFSSTGKGEKKKKRYSKSYPVILRATPYISMLFLKRLLFDYVFYRIILGFCYEIIGYHVFEYSLEML